MFVKQISAFIENSPGRLSELLKTLADANIDIYALSLADTTDFGILRLIVSDHEKAKAALKEKKVTVRLTDVLAVALTHKPGYLAELLSVMSQNDISIEYLYAFTGKNPEYGAMVIFRLADQETAAKKIENNEMFKFLSTDDITHTI